MKNSTAKVHLKSSIAIRFLLSIFILIARQLWSPILVSRWHCFWFLSFSLWMLLLCFYCCSFVCAGHNLNAKPVNAFSRCIKCSNVFRYCSFILSLHFQFFFVALPWIHAMNSHRLNYSVHFSPLKRNLLPIPSFICHGMRTFIIRAFVLFVAGHVIASKEWHLLHARLLSKTW